MLMANDKGKDKGALARLELFEFLLSEASKAKLKHLTTPCTACCQSQGRGKGSGKEDDSSGHN